MYIFFLVRRRTAINRSGTAEDSHTHIETSSMHACVCVWVWHEVCLRCTGGWRGGWRVLLQSSAGRGGGSLGKWILFSGASTRVRGLTAHYSGPRSSLLTHWWMARAAGRRCRWGGGGVEKESGMDGHRPDPPSCPTPHPLVASIFALLFLHFLLRPLELNLIFM